jgi:MFS family permease
MRDFLHRLQSSGGLKEPGLVTTAVLTLTAVAFFRVALLPEFGAELAMSTFQLGLVTTTFAAGRLLADLPGGHFADRARARSLMALAAVGVAVGSLVLGLATVVMTVYLASFLLGVSSSTTNATGMTFFSNVAGASHRGTAMAVFSAALLGGQALGPALGGLLSSVTGWRIAMFLGAALAAVLVLVLVMVRPATPSQHVSAQREVTHGTGKSSPPIGSLLVLQSVSFAMFLTLGSVPQTLIPIIGANELGLGAALIGLALGLGGVARFIGTLVGGRLSDRFSRKAALVPGLLVQGGGVGILALRPTVAIWLTAIVVMSLASFAVPVAATILGDISDPAKVGKQLGRFRFVGDLGLIAGPIIVTGIFENAGRVPAFLFVSGVLIMAGLLSWRLLPETSQLTG